MRKKALLKSVFFVLFFVLLVVLLLPSAIGSAQAQDGTVIGSMVVDCSTLSGEALQFAHDNGVCNASPHDQGEVAYDTGSSSGSCGTVWLTIADIYDGPYADMSMAALSILGPISSISYRIGWSNHNNGRTGQWFGGTAYHGATFYRSQPHLTNTGQGYVFGTLTGSATVNLQITCNFIPTSTSEVVVG